MTCKTVKRQYKHILLFLRYNHFMKVFLTILLGLLLVQAVLGLHLHTEGEDAANATASDNSTDTANVTSNETDLIGDILYAAQNDTQADQGVVVDNETQSILDKTSRNYKALKNSGDEEIAAAAKEAKAAFKEVIAGIKDKVDAAGNLSDDATDQERDAANATINSSQDDISKAYDDYNDKLEDLKEQLEAKQAAASD